MRGCIGGETKNLPLTWAHDPCGAGAGPDEELGYVP